MFTFISHTYTHTFLVVGGISISSNENLRTHSFLISTFNSFRFVGCVYFSCIFIPGIFNGVQVRAVAC